MSVPFTVVMRTRSNALAVVLDPDITNNLASFVAAIVPDIIHKLLPSKHSVCSPLLNSAADKPPSLWSNPTVNPATAPVLVYVPAVPKYPDVSTLPPPICILIAEVPFVLTPLNITVIRLTQLGIDGKSITVPDVDACAVADVSTLLAIDVRTAPEMLGEVPNTTAPLPVEDVTPVPPLATGRVPVTPVVIGRPVQVVNTPLVGVPSNGVTSVADEIVGLVPNTTAPVPVEVVTPVPPFTTGNVPLAAPT